MKAALDDPTTEGEPAISYFRSNTTIRTDRYRLIVHSGKKGETSYELYDHQSEAGESVNIADKEPETVKKLEAQMRLLIEKGAF